MTQQIHLFRRRRIVVPVRFERADDGFSEFHQPDPDNRGYAMGTRPTSGWNTTDARGPQLGILQTKTVEIKLIREDIDRRAHLYVTSTQPSICEVVRPRSGRRLPGNGIIELRGVTSRGTQPVKIQIRLGSAENGPVIAELEPHIFPWRRLPIRAHRVRIDCQTGTTVTTGRIPNHTNIEHAIERARKIWRPLGIEFTPQPTVNDTLRLSHVNQVTHPGDDNGVECAELLGLQRARRQAASSTPLPASWKDRCINWYIIHTFNRPTVAGRGVRRASADRMSSRLSRTVDPGVITVDRRVTDPRQQERLARTLAHEVGHFLGLEHCHNQHASGPAQDSYSRRALMYPCSWLKPVHASPDLTHQPRFNDAGYGRDVRGCLLTLKDHSQHDTDGECRTCHDNIQNRRWY